MLFSAARKCFQAISMAALLTLSLLMSPSDSLAAQGGVIFCERFTAETEPVGVATEFKTHEVSWIAFSTEPFNVPSLVFSIYKQSDNSTENLLHREECAVRAAWNNVFLEKMPFPGDGTYVLSFARPDGTPIAEGKVVINTQKKEEEAPALPQKIDLDGKTLDELFIKFKMLAKVAQ